MRVKHLVVDSVYMGILSGFMMGLLLKLIESLTGIKVYTLLLNVDFIPILGPVDWIEPIEFLFHLLVSIVLALVFVFLAESLQLKGRLLKSWVLSFLLCLPAIGSYFFLSLLSNKEVPQWNNWIAFTYWCVAHLFYIWLLPVLYMKKRAKR